MYWLIALATYSPALYRPMNCDCSMWFRVARDWGRGLKLYEETYDNKQPTTFMLLRLIDCPQPKLSLYLAHSLLAAGGALALRSALLRTLPAGAGVAPILLLVWSGSGATGPVTQTVESVALWFDVLAFSCFVMAIRRQSWFRMLLGGISFFLMVSFRIPALAQGLAYLPMVYLLFQTRPPRKAVFLLSGFLAGIGLALAALWIHGEIEGYWHPFLQMLWRNFFTYGSLARVPLTQSLPLAMVALRGILLGNTAMVVLVAITLVTFLARFRQLRRMERVWALACLFWLVGALAGTLPGGRHFLHYYHLIWTPLSILSVLWLSQIRTAGGSANHAGQIAWGIAVGVLALGMGNNLNHWWQWRNAARSGTDPVACIEQAAAYLQSATPAEMVVPVCVWSRWAELYWRVPRPAMANCAIPCCFPLINPPVFRKWVDAMTRSKPPLVVVDGTFLRAPLARTALYIVEAEDMQRRAGLQRMIDQEYREIRHFDMADTGGKLSVLARKGGPYDSGE